MDIRNIAGVEKKATSTDIKEQYENMKDLLGGGFFIFSSLSFCNKSKRRYQNGI